MLDSDSNSDVEIPEPEEIERFQQALLGWFRDCGKDYPWRNTSDPYAILVSELMLQQTQIVTVLKKGYFTRWLRKFPDWESLASAQEEEILKAWEGLGYYNRARNLQKAAKVICQDYEGVVPRDVDLLQSLPGVGRYTAGAVMSFAFNQRAPIVDGNVVRVLARLFAYGEPVDTPKSSRLIWEWADQLTPVGGARDYNSAIMELGQRICVRSAPACESCPVSNWCRGRRDGIESSLPRKKAKAAVTRLKERVGIAVRAGRVFLVKEASRRRKGLWRLPEIQENMADDLLEAFRFDYSITRYRVNLRVFEAPESLFEGMIAEGVGGWYGMESDEELPPLGAPYLRAIQKYNKFQSELSGANEDLEVNKSKIH
mgnify:CR=1 FL=1|tara:strand:- start:430 stop:1542 length:1113 start_codon:yes stop_codon:yes gene_type:complete